MSTRQKTIDFLLKRYNTISEAKKNGTISWVAIKEEFHQETGFNLNKDYFRNIFKTLSPVEDVIIQGNSNTPFTFLTGNENKDKGTKEFCFTADKIPSEQEIIDHFNIDITKYRISQIWHKTTPGGKYSISVNLQANKGNETINLNEEFILKLNNLQPIEQLHLPIITDKPKACLVIPKQDAHWDKFDIDGNNSIEDRFAIFTKTMLYQLEKVLKTNTLEKIIYIVGSDEFNSEWTGATTKFTPQQNTMSYQKAFEKISEFSIEFIKLLRFYTQKIIKIEEKLKPQ